jgi:uroporphyrinogen decarboxylase
MNPFSTPFKPDAQGLLDNLSRRGTPRRVFNMELFLDGEVQQELCRRFDLDKGLQIDDPFLHQQRQVRLARFLGYDCVYDNIPVPMKWSVKATDDTADLGRQGGRTFQDETRGPIANWDEFNAYPWPDMGKLDVSAFEWYEKNLPDDLCVIPNCGAHFAEHLSFLMGYETLCYALYDQPDLVAAIYDKTLEQATSKTKLLLQFKCVRAIWGSDDMGFKTSTLLSPADMRKYVLPGHKKIAELVHADGRLYLLHACGKIGDIMPDLIDDVKIDAKHSFEDTIELVIDAKRTYGRQIAIIGGIDVDFLCRSDEKAVRQRVRKTLDACLPGGGYCLGTGNSVTNYVSVTNYLAMLDEGRKYAQ